MARKQGFTLNKGTIRKILRTEDGGKREIAQQILAQIDDPDARIDIYTTDREVVGIVIPADLQAKSGAGTRAINNVVAARRQQK